VLTLQEVYDVDGYRLVVIVRLDYEDRGGKKTLTGGDIETFDTDSQGNIMIRLTGQHLSKVGLMHFAEDAKSLYGPDVTAMVERLWKQAEEQLS
jgi:hypothetical protein